MDKAKLICLLSLTLSLIAGCASTSPNPDSQVGQTAPTGDASGCKAVSNLNGLPSMPQLNDIVQDLRTQVVGAGGDIVFRESDKPPYRGTTYQCDSGVAPPK